MSVLSLHINSLTLLFLDSLYIFIIFYLLCFLFFFNYNRSIQVDSYSCKKNY